MSTIPTIPHWIDGKPYVGAEDVVVPVDNPATGEVVAQVASATPAEVETAIASAAAAFEVWSQYSLAKRTAVMFRFRELLVEHTDELAEIVTREHGKVFSDAKGEISRGLEVAEFACSIPTLLKGEYSDQAATGIDVYSFRQPVGVVAGITPFNFPVMIPLWMSPVALATGNTFVLKPPTRDPGAGMFLAELWKEAGLPDGAFTVVHGNRDVIGRLLTHPDIAAVSFVGSTTTAKHIHAVASEHGKRVQALGAAKNHAIVLADADLEHAANNLIAAAYGAAGERCMALPVALVQDSIADDLVARLTEKAAKVKVAEGMTADADMGAIISAEARDRIVSLITSAENEGARILVDGRGFAPGGLRERVLGGPDPDRRRDARDDDQQGGGLRADPGDHPDPRPRHRDQDDPGQPVRQRRGDLHLVRRGRPHLRPGAGHRRDDRRQRADPGAGRVALLRRLEGVAGRREPHLRPRGREVLHPRQGRHAALAAPRGQRAGLVPLLRRREQVGPRTEGGCRRGLPAAPALTRATGAPTG